jgi:hypothetical protein
MVAANLAHIDAVAARVAADLKLSAVKPEPSEDVDHHRNAPQPHPDCLYGLVGEIARAGSENTEANPYGIAAAALAYLGVAVGRGPYMPIGDDWNHARLFFTHVGRSSRGRKGTAKKLVIKRIAQAVSEMHPDLAPQIHTGGLSTREGLALMIHDGWTQGKEEVPPINDKRLLAVEAEFANVLHQSKRDGNTLSAALRDCWDGTSIRPAIKTSRVWASNPHVGILADITPTELRDLMAARELTNGFANRFIFFWAEGEQVNPFPKPTPEEVVEKLASAVADVLHFAGADRHIERDFHRMALSTAAAKQYARLYRGELRDRTAGERIAGLLDRRAPMLLRLAMIFALTDKSLTIEVQHVNAGMAWIRYWVDSVKFIFQTALDEVEAASVSGTAEAVTRFLIDKGKATRTQLTRECFGGHISAGKLDKALDELLTATPPVIELETVPRPKGEPGTPTKFYKLAAKSAKSANREQRRGLSQEIESGEGGEVCELSMSAGIDMPTLVRTIRTVREAPNHSIPGVVVDTSQSSHSSQGPDTEFFE